MKYITYYKYAYLEIVVVVVVPICIEEHCNSSTKNYPTKKVRHGMINRAEQNYGFKDKYY